MENSSIDTVFDAKIKGIEFTFATYQEICKASISDCPISHASQLSNPFLGLPLETGKCESCGTGDAGQCEGHFGYIELPTPIYHPDHIGELKKMLSLLCLDCLKLKNGKLKNISTLERALSSCCEETSNISIHDAKTTDGACYLELKVPLRSKLNEGFWNFLEKYGFRYGDAYSRPLLPSEVMAMLKGLRKETRKKLISKGYFPQDGYILRFLPVPPNCLSVPDISDGISTMSTDYSITLLKKVLRLVEIIKNSRSGMPNFESQEIEANDLQAAVAQYLQYRGTSKAARDVDSRFGVHKEINASSTKAWLEKMKTLFIRKGSGFSSRSVITGDPFKGVSEIGLPYEIAQKITVEERVTPHNMEFLQKLVDEKLCLTYRDGPSTYSLREGSKGHTFLRPGQIVHRRIMDGDIVFINRPPTTHKHSLQALSVYVHDDHTVKINPLICGPLGADFDGDCIHLFYPQSLEARAEVVELFLVEKQLLSSHTGNFNLQLASDSLLSLKILFRKYCFRRQAAQQFAMFVSGVLPGPAIVKSEVGPMWTASQILQTTLPHSFDYSGDRHLIKRSEVLSLEVDRGLMASTVNDLVTSLLFLKGPKEVLGFFNSMQPLLMENLYSEGFSISLRDFYVHRDILEDIQENIQKLLPLLCRLRDSYSESIALQLDSELRSLRSPITGFVVNSSAIGQLIDSKSESALSKVVQQIGFVGLQISTKGKFYSETLVTDISSLFRNKYPSSDDYPTEEFGLVCKPLFRGLDPYQEMVHSISSREVIVRSSRGLTEPGTLFKNLMAILRDVVICYDGTVRNMCSNSIIQFEYGANSNDIVSEFCAGDPVGVLAATAMSNPAYKAVLDSSSSSNSSWQMMKEILLCGVSFKNDISDRRVILYLADCDCRREHCKERAALIIQNQLKKITLEDIATEFLIEYGSQTMQDSYEINTGLVGHIHLDKMKLMKSNTTMHEILAKCQDKVHIYQKKKKIGNFFKKIDLSFSDCCSFCKSSDSKWTKVSCVQLLWRGAIDDSLDRTSHFLADTVCPVVLQTVIKGDPRVSTADIVWISPETATWIRSPSKTSTGELALEIVLEKEAVKKSGDAWRVAMDCCLAVMHLIDTRRSIPYAIKQVQELLGISCTFEQAVQRLSTSVTMVTKGVLKDHLLLLGDSMTCDGTLIGFNAGGIKALSRSLNIHAPFMNATLFTPRKCFERAAEKCHVDNLSTVVGSCAWGRHVSVGSGSPFEILWDTRKSELKSDKEIDVYNFLQLVSTSFRAEDIGTSCLGTEIEDLDQEGEFMDFDLSPEREPGADKPTFEDGLEFPRNNNESVGEPESNWSSWEKKIASGSNDWTNKTEMNTCRPEVDSGGRDWAKKSEEKTWGKKSDDWLSWDKKKNTQRDTFLVKSQENSLPVLNSSPWAAKVADQAAERIPSNTWGSTEKPKQVDSGGSGWAKKAEEKTWGKKNDDLLSWDKENTQREDTFSVKSQEDSLPLHDSSPWDAKVADQAACPKPSNTWGSTEKPKQVDSGGSGWAKKAEETTWGKKNDDRPSWVNENTRREDTFLVKSQEDSLPLHDSSPWDAKVADQADDPKPSNTWGSTEKPKQVDAGGSGWARKAEETTWGKKNDDRPSWDKENTWREDTFLAKSQEDLPPLHDSSPWDAKVDDQAAVPKLSNTWGSTEKPKQVNSGGSGWTKKAEETTWGKKNDDRPSWVNENTRREDTFLVKSQEDSLPLHDSSPWDAKVADQASDPKPSSTWASTRDWRKHDLLSPTGLDKESPVSTRDPVWKQPEDYTKAQDWAPQGGSTSVEKDVEPQWGRGRGRGWSRGRGRGRGGRGREGLLGQGPYTAPMLVTGTRQRLDLFTAEEQDVLLETELIMKNIRNVLNQTGYKDGDPLSADDQAYIVDNVLNYHPDKAIKIGSGLDYIMINKHAEFQDSRCFYAVSVDGLRSDFSYRKCLESFIRGKYPEKAEAFISKYFKKPQSRSGWNRNHDSSQSGAGTPSHSTPAPDEAGTPGWIRDSAPGPDTTGTPW